MNFEKIRLPGTINAYDRQARQSHLLVVNCRRADNTIVAIRVRNLSGEGLGGIVTGATQFQQGERVEIQFRNVSGIAASVVWFRGDAVGIQFGHPVDLSSITEARKWYGPAFVLADQHKVKNECWRPGVLSPEEE